MKKAKVDLSRIATIALLSLAGYGATVLAVPVSGSLYSGWSNYKDYMMDPSATGISSNLVKFPVLVRLTSVNSAILSNPTSPADLRFAKGSNLNVSYPYQIDEWDTANHQASIWVLVDTVFSASTAQSFRMYWGNDTASAGSNPTAVFDTGNGFAGVYHFSNNILDATAFARNATVASATDTLGIIGHARKFIEANDDSVMIPGLMGSNATLTLSLWVNENAIGGSANGVDLISLGDNAAIRSLYNNSTPLQDSLNGFYYGNGNWQNIYSPGGTNVLGQGWKYLAYVINPASSTEQVYLNGRVVASGTLNYALNYSGRGANTIIGHHANGNTAYYGLGGLIDEPRVDKVARTADWINFCYATQNLNQTAVFEVPAVPTLTAPTNSAVNQPVTPNLMWTMGSAATSYSVLISTSSSFSTTVFNQSGIPTTSVTASGLAITTAYYWEVNATNVNLTSAWSSIWSFTTTGTLPPGAPVLALPTNGATAQPVALSLNWGTVNLATTYGVQVSTNSSFASGSIAFSQSGLTTHAVAISGLANSTVYYWSANAANAGGNGSWSAVWSFTTAGAPPSTAPQLAAPGNGLGGFSLPINFQWQAVTGATSYELQVGTAQAFGSTVFDKTGITADSITVKTLLGNMGYYWRAAAWNGNGPGPWSSAWYFGTAGTSIISRAITGIHPDFSVNGEVLSYSLSASGAVEISFSDLLGRSALVLNRKQIAGKYAVDLKSCNLAAGQYLVRFKTAGFEKRASVVITR